MYWILKCFPPSNGMIRTSLIVLLFNLSGNGIAIGFMPGCVVTNLLLMGILNFPSFIEIEFVERIRLKSPLFFGNAGF